MNHIRIASFALLLVMFSALAAETTSGEYRLKQLSWLVGDWRLEDDRQLARETWVEPVNGFMWAVFRLFVDERLVVHEYVLVTEEAGEVMLRFKHFNADYSTWEKDGPLTFRLTKVRDGYALFENIAPSPEAPDVIEYQRSGDELIALVSDKPGSRAGEAMEFRFKLHP